jgi:hypothetical protein
VRNAPNDPAPGLTLPTKRNSKDVDSDMSKMIVNPTLRVGNKFADNAWSNRSSKQRERPTSGGALNSGIAYGPSILPPDCRCRHSEVCIAAGRCRAQRSCKSGESDLGNARCGTLVERSNETQVERSNQTKVERSNETHFILRISTPPINSL